MLSVLIVLIFCVYHCIKKMPFETINQKVALSQNLFNQKGSFSNHAESILRSLVTKDPSSVKSFDRLSTALEKLEFLQKHVPNLDFSTTINSDGAFVERDLNKALEYKGKGNELFKANNLMEAKDMYTTALQYCPFDSADLTNNKEYATILANRSACTDKVGLYEAVVQDIDCAMKYGYPRHWHYKVHNRKGHALLKIRRFDDARIEFAKCKDMIGKSDMKTQEMRDKYRIRLAKQMSVFNVKKGVPNDVEHMAGSPLTKLTKKEKRSFGDDVCLKGEVKCEDVILCERPFAAVLQDDKAEGKICPHTLEVLTAGVPCTFGSKALFANEEARQEAGNSYHKYEWSSLHLVQAANLSPASKLAYRIVTTIGPYNVAKIVKAMKNNPIANSASLVLTEDNEDETKNTNQNDKTLRQAINLLTLCDKTEEQFLVGEEKLKLGVLVAFLLSCLEKGGFFSDKNSAPSKEDVLFLLEKCLLLTGLSKDSVQSVIYSQGSVDKSSLWDIPYIPVKEFALAVYPDFSGARYLQKTKKASGIVTEEKSDVLLGYHKGTLFLQSLRNLKSGVGLNLQNIVGVGSSLQDLSKLNIPGNMITYKCSGKNCSLSFPLPEKTGQNVITCPLEECGTETNIWNHRRRIVELRGDHEAARGKIEGISGDGGVKGIDEGVTILKCLIDEWDEFVCRPNKDLTTLEQDLTKALLLKHIESEKEFMKKGGWR